MKEESHTHAKTNTPQTHPATGEFPSPPLGGGEQILGACEFSLREMDHFSTDTPQLPGDSLIGRPFIFSFNVSLLNCLSFV